MFLSPPHGRCSILRNHDILHISSLSLLLHIPDGCGKHCICRFRCRHDMSWLLNCCCLKNSRNFVNCLERMSVRCSKSGLSDSRNYCWCFVAVAVVAGPVAVVASFVAELVVLLAELLLRFLVPDMLLA